MVELLLIDLIQIKGDVGEGETYLGSFSIVPAGTESPKSS